MTTTLQSQLAEVLALGALATPGPFVYEREAHEIGVGVMYKGVVKGADGENIIRLGYPSPNLAFIAAACNLARSPALREALADRLSVKSGGLSDADVYTLMGDAEVDRMRGETDMPKYKIELAAKIARTIGDHHLAGRADEMLAAMTAPALEGKGPCDCAACLPQSIHSMRMIVCATCGNKRCPHATDHRNTCTNSNATGQAGSSWEHITTPAADRGQGVGDG